MIIPSLFLHGLCNLLPSVAGRYRTRQQLETVTCQFICKYQLRGSNFYLILYTANTISNTKKRLAGWKWELHWDCMMMNSHCMFVSKIGKNLCIISEIIGGILRELKLNTKEYWVIYRGPGFLRSYDFAPPPSPVSKSFLFLSLPVCRRSS